MDGIRLSGYWHLRIRGPDGGVVDYREGANLVVVSGYELVAALVAGEAVAAPGWMAAGDGTEILEETQTALMGTEKARTTMTVTRNNHILSYTADFSALNTNEDVSEFGLFNAASAGSMLARFITESFTLFAGQSMEVVWEIRIGQ